MSENPTLSLAAIQERRRALQQELADLDAAERVIRALGARFPQQAPQEPGPLTTMAEAIETVSIKRTILSALWDAGQQGMTAQNVLFTIQTKGGRSDYRAANVSPKLSFYKDKGLVRLDGGLWRLTDAGAKELSPTKS